MLAAELHGKTTDDAPASQRSEDVLTSYVFSLFRYFDNPRIPGEWLRLARNLAEEPLPLDAIDRASVAFWPTVILDGPTRYREPDAVLALRDSHGREVALVVEAKFHAGLSNQALASDHDAQASEDAGATPPPGHQLGDDVAALTRGRWIRPEGIHEWFARASQRAVLYVTAHYAIPRTDIEGASPTAAGSIFWVSWRSLWDVLERAKQADYPGCRPGERNLLRDVQEMLLHRGLAGFVNRLQDLSPVEPYERHIFLLGRALAPVEPYTPQLVPAGK